MEQFALRLALFAIAVATLMMVAQGKPIFALGYVLTTILAYVLHQLTHAPAPAKRSHTRAAGTHSVPRRFAHA